MLDLLDRHGAKATFFAIGEKASAHPELVAEICRRGHTVGNHTQTHPLAAFWLAGPRRTAREVDACDAALQRAGAAVSPWFRAPAGIKTFFLRRVLADRGRVLVGWSARGRETFSASPAAPLRRLQRNIRPGAILLVHESATNGAARVALLTALLEHLSATGYRCVLPERDALR
jgi:peptidoglycan/xylan/chitin deacetylase (PgdA/CDA1 family)